MFQRKWTLFLIVDTNTHSWTHKFVLWATSYTLFVTHICCCCWWRWWWCAQQERSQDFKWVSDNNVFNQCYSHCHLLSLCRSFTFWLSLSLAAAAAARHTLFIPTHSMSFSPSTSSKLLCYPFSSRLMTSATWICLVLFRFVQCSFYQLKQYIRWSYAQEHVCRSFTLCVFLSLFRSFLLLFYVNHL